MYEPLSRGPWEPLSLRPSLDPDLKQVSQNYKRRSWCFGGKSSIRVGANISGEGFDMVIGDYRVR